LLLIGRRAQVEVARDYLTRAPGEGETTAPFPTGEVTGRGKLFGGSVLQTFIVPKGRRVGQTLAELKVSQKTGVRIAGIRREGRQIINPGGAEPLQTGDCVLVVGTMSELGTFRKWMTAA
jgi:Trk K+ transport system NAD-binding subunit